MQDCCEDVYSARLGRKGDDVIVRGWFAPVSYQRARLLVIVFMPTSLLITTDLPVSGTYELQAYYYIVDPHQNVHNTRSE